MNNESYVYLGEVIGFILGMSIFIWMCYWFGIMFKDFLYKLTNNLGKAGRFTAFSLVFSFIFLFLPAYYSLASAFHNFATKGIIMATVVFVCACRVLMEAREEYKKSFKENNS